MRNQLLNLAATGATTAVVGAVAALLGTQTSAQGPTTSATTLKTPWAEPDLQGIWTIEFDTPLQRPAKYANQEFFTEAQRAELDQARSGILNRRATERDVNNGYNGAAFFSMKRTGARTSRVVDPPNGRFPPLTPEAAKRRAEHRAKAKGHQFDGPENMSLSARCIARANVGPPLLPSAYNSNLQIVQGAGYVVIEAEMIHDARVIPTDGRPHIAKNVKQWMGDSVGHWEGNTLVIDTTNFTDLNPFEDAQNVHVVERLTRVDADTILYQFTVEDPGMWTKPWSGELPITKMQGQLYEYACHEANYGLVNTLNGARVAEAEAAKKAGK